MFVKTTKTVNVFQLASVLNINRKACKNYCVHEVNKDSCLYICRYTPPSTFVSVISCHSLVSHQYFWSIYSDPSHYYTPRYIVYGGYIRLSVCRFVGPLVCGHFLWTLFLSNPWSEFNITSQELLIPSLVVHIVGVLHWNYF